MQLVIDIPEEIYLNVKKDYLYDTEVIVNAFKNGTPLPKGHGRLIDADELKKVINQFDYYDQVSDAPTIIEADKEE